MSASSPLRRLLLIGRGGELYRRHLLSSIASEFEVWLATDRDPGWADRYLAGWLHVDVTDPEALVAWVRLFDRELPVDGVLCWDESLILPAAHVGAALGLPGPTVDAVTACRDKHKTRRRLDAEAVPQARSLAVRNLGAAHGAGNRLGYPLVIKPRGLGASRGVVKVDRPTDLPAAWAHATAASYPGVPTYDDMLVEEYLDGPEISVDGVIAGGRYTPLFVAHKEIGLAPYFEETGHRVSAADPLLTDPVVLDVLTRAHQALGFDQGWTHSELRLTTAGPRVVEVNGRLGGDLIPRLGQLATGLDPGLVAATVAVGESPVVRPTCGRRAAIRFVYPDRDCVIDGVTIDPAATSPGPGVHVEAAALAAPGTELRLPPGGYVARVAYALAAADDHATCVDALDRAVDGIDYRGSDARALVLPRR